MNGIGKKKNEIISMNIRIIFSGNTEEICLHTSCTHIQLTEYRFSKKTLAEHNYEVTC